MRVKFMRSLGTVAMLLTLSLGLNLVLNSAQAGDDPIAQSVIKLPLADGVSMDDAVDSMKLRANVLNFKLVAQLPLYKELEAMGIESGRMEIFQFCDARIAHEMLKHNLDFAAYLPCRITLIQDNDGKPWLVTLDLNQIMQQVDLPAELEEQAKLVRDNIESIITAGANGDL